MCFVVFYEKSLFLLLVFLKNVPKDIEIMNKYDTKTQFAKSHSGLATRAIKNDLYKFSEWKNGNKEAAKRKKGIPVRKEK